MSIGFDVYKSVEDCELFTFPFKRQGTGNYTLRTIKQGHIVDLLTTNEYPSLDYDSYFCTLKANKHIF